MICFGHMLMGRSALVVFLLLVVQVLLGQVISRNSDGDIIVTYADGSWRHFMSSDSTMLKDAFDHFMKRERDGAMAADHETDKAPSEREQRARRRLLLETRKRRIDEGLLTVREKEYQALLDELAELSMPMSETEPKEVRKPLFGLIKSGNETSTSSTTASERQSPRGKPLFGQQKSDEADVMPPMRFTIRPAIADYDRSAEAFTVASTDVVVPDQPCSLDTSQTQRLTERRIMMPGQLVSTTHSLQPPASHPLQAQVALMDVFGSIFMNVTLQTKPDADHWPQGAILDAGEVVKLVLVDGEIINLEQTAKNVPRREAFSTVMNYHIKTLLAKEDQRRIKRTALDELHIKVAGHWYVYEIYDVFLLRRQLTCLENS